MARFIVIINGWTEAERYTIEAETEGDAIAQAYKLADAPFASLVEIEQES